MAKGVGIGTAIFAATCQAFWLAIGVGTGVGVGTSQFIGVDEAVATIESLLRSDPELLQCPVTVQTLKIASFRYASVAMTETDSPFDPPLVVMHRRLRSWSAT